MSLITTTDVLPYLSSITTTVDGNDATLLSDLIDGVEKFVSEYILSPLELTTVTEYLSGKGLPYITLKNIPTGNISVYVDSDREFSDDTLVDSTTYVVYDLFRKVELIDGTIFPIGVRNIKVVYDTGWDITTLPKDLKMVMCDIVANMFYHIRNKTESNATRGGMGSSATFIQDKFILPQHYHILNTYRRVNI